MPHSCFLHSDVYTHVHTQSQNVEVSIKTSFKGILNVNSNTGRKGGRE
jgi:hypothetical protein